MQKNQKNAVFSILLSGMMLLAIEMPAELPADEFFCFETPRYCSVSSWGWWVGGLLGVAAGAGAGYAAGQGRGKKGGAGDEGRLGPEGARGNQGIIGPQGPQGPSVVYNTTDPLQLEIDNRITDNFLLVQAVFSNAVSGTTIDEFIISIAGPMGIAVDLPALQSKLEGDYYLTLTILRDADESTEIGNFRLFDGTNFIFLQTVDGFPPSFIRTWTTEDPPTILRAAFNPPPPPLELSQ